MYRSDEHGARFAERMPALRRGLYLHAAVWALAGVVLAAAPGFAVHTVFREAVRFEREGAWLRLLGVESLGLAMVATMVGHRVEDLWWWSWAFAIVDLLALAVVALNAAFGLGPKQPVASWWIFSGVLAFLFAGVLHGLYVSARERPLP